VERLATRIRWDLVSEARWIPNLDVGHACNDHYRCNLSLLSFSLSIESQGTGAVHTTQADAKIAKMGPKHGSKPPPRNDD
jgi:hypothetical protein